MKVKTLFVIVVVAVVAIILLGSAFYIVDETEQAVVTQFGKPVRITIGGTTRQRAVERGSIVFASGYSFRAFMPALMSETWNTKSALSISSSEEP